MTWETAFDRLSMLTAVGGETATIYTGVFGESPFGDVPFGGNEDIIGVLDRDFVDVKGIECEAPIFTCRTADVTDVVHGIEVLVNSTTYVVRGIRNDGTGMTVLVLEEQ